MRKNAIHSARSIRPSGFAGNGCTLVVGASPEDCVTTRIADSPCNICASEGVRPRESRTIRAGGWASARVLSSSDSGKASLRSVRRQSSASTVPTPVTIKSDSARRRCTSWRASSPVIHWLSPEAIAVRPSSDVAIFTVMRPYPRRILSKKPAKSCSTASAPMPTSTAMPASRS